MVLALLGDALKDDSTKIGVSDNRSWPQGRGFRVEFTRQAADRARKLFPHWTVEIKQGARYTTYQTSFRTLRLQTFDPVGLRAMRHTTPSYHPITSSHRTRGIDNRSVSLPPSLVQSTRWARAGSGF
ncbi:hypothetical protein BDM02DRAFT_881245 [Thelephora ganbajun]|uniref:Uncharacterized protein n=1 Tax=Thelephora ganbajun TaxID=370292 RepID=A0ACB6Z5B6_THEGA|nr:hypothetical protein BDM02DRAFT_881245 [Thelephora ganbajun]